MQTLSDERLVTLYRESGNPECYAILFHRHYARLSGILGRYCEHRENLDLDGILNETFLLLHQWCKGTERIQNVQAWLVGTLKHKAQEFIRHASRQKRGFGRTVSLDTTPVHVSREDSPTVEIGEQVTELRKAVDQLNSSMREILRLRLAGNSDADIAQYLNLPLGTVKTRQRAAVRQLKEKLENIAS